MVIMDIVYKEYEQRKQTRSCLKKGGLVPCTIDRKASFIRRKRPRKLITSVPYQKPAAYTEQAKLSKNLVPKTQISR